MYPTEQKPLWTPSPERIAAANVTAFRRAAERRWGVPLPDYEALHAWSVAQPARFWTSVWEGDGVGSGVIGKYRWQVSAARYALADGAAPATPAAAQLWEVAATVEWPAATGREPYRLTLSTLRLQGAPSP